MFALSTAGPGRQKGLGVSRHMWLRGKWGLKNIGLVC